MLEENMRVWRVGMQGRKIYGEENGVEDV